MERILPEYEAVGDLEIHQAVFQAIGAASVSWSETPKGVFDSDRALQIGNELLGVIQQRIEAARLHEQQHGDPFPGIEWNDGRSTTV